MRTVIIIIAGLLLLGLFALVGRLSGAAGGAVTAAKLFMPLWLAAAAVNMWFGVSRAGYSVSEEFPIFLAIFAVPAAIAGLLWWKLS